MLTVKSRIDAHLGYVFESAEKPVTLAQLHKEKSITGVPTSIDMTVTVSRDGPPVAQVDHDSLKAVMQDCAHPELAAAYADRHASMMRFLGCMGLEGKEINVYTIRTQ